MAKASVKAKSLKKEEVRFSISNLLLSLSSWICVTLILIWPEVFMYPEPNSKEEGVGAVYALYCREILMASIFVLFLFSLYAAWNMGRNIRRYFIIGVVVSLPIQYFLFIGATIKVFGK